MTKGRLPQVVFADSETCILMIRLLRRRSLVNSQTASMPS